MGEGEGEGEGGGGREGERAHDLYTQIHIIASRWTKRERERERVRESSTSGLFVSFITRKELTLCNYCSRDYYAVTTQSTVLGKS